MEKKDTILLLFFIGSIITFIFGIDVVRLAFLLPVETGGPIAMMAIGVIIITTIIFPILIIIFGILTLRVLDNNTVGIVFGFIILAMCIVALLFCIFYTIVVGLVPGDVANIVMRIRSSLAVCIVGQIIVLIGAILNLRYQFNK